MKHETSFCWFNMHKWLHTHKIKEKHNYTPTKIAIKGTQTNYLVLYLCIEAILRVISFYKLLHDILYCIVIYTYH